MAEKSEAATPKKLRDARKKGQVAKSQDFPSAFTFIVSISMILTSAQSIYEQLSSYMRFAFGSIATNIDMKNRAGGFLEQSFMVILNVTFPILLITVISGVLVSFLIVGPLFSLQAMVPDIKRLNPVDNIRNIFKFKTLFELLKSMFKITGAILLIYSVVMDSVGEIVATAALPIVGSLLVFGNFLTQVVVRVGIFFIVVATIDLIYQKRNFASEMKMEKFQVKQEYKDSEGDPQLKSKRRQRAQEIAYQDGPAATRNARAVITNPTDIAIAIHYDDEVEGEPEPPMILAKGSGTLAAEIIAVALEYKVPIVRNVPLAQLLMVQGEIGESIPSGVDDEIYMAVAEVLQYLSKLSKPEQDVNRGLFT